jgi:N-acetylglucosaminyl-diphospho-decaprenol L-rhamnosyltransferase
VTYEHDLSIIVVAWNVIELVDECLRHVRDSQDHLRKQVLFVDNGSTDGTPELVAERYPEVTLIRADTNLGFIRANNLAYPHATGRYVLMLNSDAFVGPNTFERTVAFMNEHPLYGVLGCRLVGRDGTPQPSARNFPTPFRSFVSNLSLDRKFGRLRGIDDLDQDVDAVTECDWVSGCYLLARKAALDELGWFLTEDYFMYNDDNDLCLRLSRKGWKTVCHPEKVVHIGGGNADQLGELTAGGRQVDSLAVESTYLYYRRNYGLPRVLSQYTWRMAYRLARIVKRVARAGRGGAPVSFEVRSASAETGVLLRTRFGRRSVH